MEITLIKKVTYKLEPFGKFVIKDKIPRNGETPNMIPLDELNIRHDTGMPMTKEQDDKIVALMKKHKTDILTDGYNTYFTRTGSGFTEVWHKKLSKYNSDPVFKNVVDNGHSWGAVMLSSK